MLRKQSAKRGWLWRRSSEKEPWTKTFASIKGSYLNLYKDDKVKQPFEVVNLAGSTAHEVGLESGKPPGRTSRSIRLQVPSPEAEKLQSLLPVCDFTFRADDRIDYLSALDSNDHSHWLKQLRQAASATHPPNSLAVEEERSLNGFRKKAGKHTSGNPLVPSLAVSTFLASTGRLFGPELLTVLKRAQETLQEGSVNIGAAREEALKSQFALNGVRRQLHEINTSTTYRLRDPEDGCLPVESDVRIWAEDALHFMHDVDAKLENLLMKDAPFAPDWVVFAYDTINKLRTMEEALRLGKYAHRHKQKCTEATGSCAHKAAASPRPVLPISHWKHKIAL